MPRTNQNNDNRRSSKGRGDGRGIQGVGLCGGEKKKETHQEAKEKGHQEKEEKTYKEAQTKKTLKKLN